MENAPDNWIPTRQSLLSRLKNWDDQESWRDFFDTYSKLIYSTAMKAGLNNAEAQEVVQETTILVAKKIKDFKYDPAIGSFKSWLLQATRWRIADQFRKRQRDNGRVGHPDGGSTRTDTVDRLPDLAAASLDTIWEQEWQQTMFEAALEKIKRRVNPKHYQIFDLYVRKQWPASKIARSLGVNIGVVYLAKHRVAALLKKELRFLEDKGL